MSAVLLVAHGSRDPRAAATTVALARAVSRARPGVDVRVAYLDHAVPTVGAALAGLAADGYPSVVVVPLLLTEAYHGRVDLPALLADAPLVVHRAPVLGSDPALVRALRRRLAPGYDALVLAAAGTRDAGARAGIAAVAEALGRAEGVPCRAAYASAAGPTPGEAVAELRAAGAGRVAVASYFLAPGLLYDRAAGSARDAGAVSVAAPLNAAPELVALVAARAGVARAAAVSSIMASAGPEGAAAPVPAQRNPPVSGGFLTGFAVFRRSERGPAARHGA